jgi:hypothetical protein
VSFEVMIQGISWVLTNEQLSNDGRLSLLAIADRLMEEVKRVELATITEG